LPVVLTPILRQLKLLSAVILSVVLSVSLHASPADKAKYGPDPGNPFLQVIQSSDYPTIEFIGSLYRPLNRVSSEEHHPKEFGSALSCEITETSLTFRAKDAGKTKTVTVAKKGQQSTTIGKVPFTNPATQVFFSALLTIVTDLVKTTPCREVRFTQFGTRAYKRRTIIEFDFGAQVVVIDCFSNGPKNDERLYVLDVVARRESMFWSHESSG